MQIIPTIIEKQFSEAVEKIRLSKDDFKWIQIDVIDGIYSVGKTFELELLNKTGLVTDNTLWEIHLMVKEPVKWIEKCEFIYASRIIGQVEMMSDIEEFISRTKDAGLEAGLGFDIDTPIGDIPSETDLVLLMARKSGFEYQKFEEKIFEKIKKLREFRKEKDLKFRIGIDGGINENNILELKKIGVDIAYCGSTIFNGNVNNNILKLNEIINNN